MKNRNKYYNTKLFIINKKWNPRKYINGIINLILSYWEHCRRKGVSLKLKLECFVSRFLDIWEGDQNS
jgi:hypothetical protein